MTRSRRDTALPSSCKQFNFVHSSQRKPVINSDSFSNSFASSSGLAGIKQALVLF